LSARFYEALDRLESRPFSCGLAYENRYFPTEVRHLLFEVWKGKSYRALFIVQDDDWISQAVAEPEIETLPDDELLTRSDSALAADLQEELSGLLADARENKLDAMGSARLDQLMALYRRGMVQKARAWREAVARGLRTSLTADDANADHAA
jgi:hypothetical protein